MVTNTKSEFSSEYTWYWQDPAYDAANRWRSTYDALADILDPLFPPPKGLQWESRTYSLYFLLSPVEAT